jgi:Domain of unknown function (DUF4307)
VADPESRRSVTDLNATTVPTPLFPPGRYGRRRAPRRPRRWLAVLLATLVAVASGGIGYRLYKQYGDKEYTPLILSETERTEDHVTIRFQVRSRSGREPAVCRVRARARDGLVVGASDVPVAAGRRVTRTFTLPTSERAFVVDIATCRTATTDR